MLLLAIAPSYGKATLFYVIYTGSLLNNVLTFNCFY